MSRWLHAAALLLPGALLACALCVTGDLLRMSPEAARFVQGFGDWVATLALLLGIYAVSGALLLLVGAAVLSTWAGHDPALALYLGRSGVFDMLLGRNNEPQRGARLLAAIALVPSSAGLLFVAAQHFMSQYNTPLLVAAATTAVALLLGLLSLVVYTVLWRWLVALTRWRVGALLVHARSALAVLVLAGLLLALLAVVYEREIFKEIDGWRLYLMVGGLGLFVVTPLCLPERVVHWLRPRPSAAHITVAGALTLIAVLGFVLAPGNPRARALVDTSGRSASTLISLWSSALDFDGDGIASVLGGGDCAAFDPMIYPGSVDIPDNDVDEDCLDGDLKAPPPPAVRPPLTHPKIAVAQPDIVIFSIDACRRDSLGVYGAPKDRSPNIDRFAKDAFVFEDAIAQSSWTQPSFAAILTGRYASELPGFYGSSRVRALPDDVELLPQPLQKAGYRTVAVTAGLQLDRLGIKRGFQEWRNLTRTPHGNFAVPVAEAGAEILRTAQPDKPLFLWMHVVDLHYPYEAPREHRLFGSSRQQLYQAELHYADSAFAKVLDALDASGRAERTIVVMFSDHGEAFKEHGIDFHGFTVYAEEIEVPLMLRIPGLKPRRIDGPVGLVDLAPTLWDLARVDSDAAPRGRSLAPAIVDGRPVPERHIFSEQTRYQREFALTTRDWRLRYDQTHNYVELFDRKADPQEQNNLFTRMPHVGQALRQALAREMAPISYIAGQQLGEVLLRELPEDHVPIKAPFVEGPVAVGLQVEELAPGRLNVSVVLRARGPLLGKKQELHLSLRQEDGKVLGERKQELTGGVYVAGRWRNGDLVRHKSTLSIRGEASKVAQICIGLVEDSASLPLEDGSGVRACIPVKVAPPPPNEAPTKAPSDTASPAKALPDKEPPSKTPPSPVRLLGKEPQPSSAPQPSPEPTAASAADSKSGA